MSQFSKMYKPKKKRVRDPNLPPAPNLLSQVKELRLTKEEQMSQLQQIRQQQAEIQSLKSKLRTTEYRLDLLTSIMRQNRK